MHTDSRSASPQAGLAVAMCLLIAPMIGAQEDQAPDFDRWDPTDENLPTGPAVGEKIPDFEAIDQHGKQRSFADIKGPNGALILFYRSADW